MRDGIQLGFHAKMPERGSPKMKFPFFPGTVQLKGTRGIPGAKKNLTRICPLPQLGDISQAPAPARHTRDGLTSYCFLSLIVLFS